MKPRLFIILLIASLGLARGAEVPEDRGAMGLDQALRRLDVVASVLHTGAHPDDENSALLSDRKSTRLNSSHVSESRMPSSA